MDRIEIEVTERNIWFLERSIPLFGKLDLFPASSVGGPALPTKDKKSFKGEPIHLETDQGWTISTDITSDANTFRNSSRSRGTGKWVHQAELQPGDKIVIVRIDEFRYKLVKETHAA